MSAIMLMTLPTLSAASLSVRICSLLRLAWRTASAVIRLDSVTCMPISRTEAESSSAAKPFGLDHAVLEHLDGNGHGADLILAADSGDFRRHVAPGEHPHARRHGADRFGDTVCDQQSEADAGNHADDAENDRDIDRGLDLRERIGTRSRGRPLRVIAQRLGQG